MPFTECKCPASATPAQRFLFKLADEGSPEGDFPSIGKCDVCHGEDRPVGDLFPAGPGGEIQPHDRLVCPQCLALGMIAERLGAVSATVEPAKG